MDNEKTNIEYGSTQGKKGQKLPRINLGFSTENHNYLKFESRRRGLTITAFINLIIEEHRRKNDDF